MEYEIILLLQILQKHRIIECIARAPSWKLVDIQGNFCFMVKMLCMHWTRDDHLRQVSKGGCLQGKSRKPSMCKKIGQVWLQMATCHLIITEVIIGNNVTLILPSVMDSSQSSNPLKFLCKIGCCLFFPYWIKQKKS